VCLAIVNVFGRGAVDEQAEKFRPAIVSAGVHEVFAFVDHGEVEVGDGLAFTAAEWFA